MTDPSKALTILKEILIAVVTATLLAALIYFFHRLATSGPSIAEIRALQAARIDWMEHNGVVAGRLEWIIAAILGLIGPFIGYYAGRVPAERQAAAAESSRNEAMQDRRAAETQARLAEQRAGGASALLARSLPLVNAAEKENAALAELTGARSLSREISDFLNPPAAGV